jgi:hypothetical protein
LRGHEAVRWIIRVRQHELGLLVEQVETSLHSEDESRPELTRRLEEAKALMVEQSTADDEDSAYDLLSKLDGIVPLIADDRRLLLMLESELDRSDSTYGTATRARAVRLLEYRARASLERPSACEQAAELD